MSRALSSILFDTFHQFVPITPDAAAAIHAPDPLLAHGFVSPATPAPLQGWGWAVAAAQPSETP